MRIGSPQSAKPGAGEQEPVRGCEKAPEVRDRHIAQKYYPGFNEIALDHEIGLGGTGDKFGGIIFCDRG